MDRGPVRSTGLLFPDLEPDLEVRSTLKPDLNLEDHNTLL